MSRPDPHASLWHRVDAAKRAAISPHLNGPPVSIGAVADALCIEVLASALSSDISGQIRYRVEDGKYEIKVNVADAPVRQRFTVAHEIGHFLLHLDDITGDGIKDTVLFRSKLSDRKEAEANKMAAILLLPWDAVSKWAEVTHKTKVGPELLQQIASAWKVSALTVGYRFGF